MKILGMGEHVPGKRVGSDQLDRFWNKPAGWTLRHSGIEHRYFAASGETSSAMAASASRQALAAAGTEAAELDCIISACSVMEQPIPCMAALIQRALGLGDSGIPAFDVNATCLSFLTALDLASTLIAAGRYRRVLVVSSEMASAGLPWDEPATAMLFGDGAVAAVLAPSDGDAALLAAHFETYAEGAEHCQVRAGGTRIRVGDDPELFRQASVFRMNGRATYRAAAQRMPPFLERLLERAGTGVDGLAAIVPHQASDKALRHLQTLLELPPAKLVTVLRNRGNQMAASVGVALHTAWSSGQVGRGDTVALVGSGAGLAFGGVVLRL